MSELQSQIYHPPIASGRSRFITHHLMVDALVSPHQTPIEVQNTRARDALFDWARKKFPVLKSAITNNWQDQSVPGDKVSFEAISGYAPDDTRLWAARVRHACQQTADRT